MNDHLLVMTTDRRAYAVPLRVVDEIMRPLAVEPVGGVPPFVLGIAIVRGRPMAILDLAAIVGGTKREGSGRMLVLRVDDTRRVGLLVDDVIGVRRRGDLGLHDRPPLLADADAGVLDAIGRLDDAVVRVLQLGELVPPGAWASSPTEGTPA